KANAGLPIEEIRSLAISRDAQLFAATTSGIYRSMDRATTWTAIGAGLASQDADAIACDSLGNIYAAVGGTLYGSNDRAAHWNPLANAPTASAVRALAVGAPGVLFVVYRDETVWRGRTDAGEWRRITLPGSGRVTAVRSEIDGSLLVGTA